jgi:hypothetical protein
MPAPRQILAMARFDQGAVCYLRSWHHLAWTVWYLVEWSDLGKGGCGMRRGTREALSFRSSVRSVVGLLRGAVVLLVPVDVLLVPVDVLLVPVDVLLVPVDVLLRGVVVILLGVVALLRGVVLLLVHVVLHLREVVLLLVHVAAPSEAVSAVPLSLTTSSKTERKKKLLTVVLSQILVLQKHLQSDCRFHPRCRECVLLSVDAQTSRRVDTGQTLRQLPHLRNLHNSPRIPKANFRTYAPSASIATSSPLYCRCDGNNDRYFRQSTITTACSVTTKIL